MIVTAFLRRKRVLLGVMAAVAVAALVAWRELRMSELAQIGAGYAAQQTCACIFISGRTLASCKTDLEPLAQKLVSLRVGTDEVTAHSLAIGTATARFEQGFGCSLRN
jgi:hypothetical protein